jgi:hypothetical protein
MWRRIILKTNAEVVRSFRSMPDRTGLPATKDWKRFALVQLASEWDVGKHFPARSRVVTPY